MIKNSLQDSERSVIYTLKNTASEQRPLKRRSSGSIVIQRTLSTGQKLNGSVAARLAYHKILQSQMSSSTHFVLTPELDFELEGCMEDLPINVLGSLAIASLPNNSNYAMNFELFTNCMETLKDDSKKESWTTAVSLMLTAPGAACAKSEKQIKRFLRDQLKKAINEYPNEDDYIIYSKKMIKDTQILYDNMRLLYGHLNRKCSVVMYSPIKKNADGTISFNLKVK